MNEESQGGKDKKSKAAIICVILTIVTLGTIALGYIYKNPFIVILGILPAAVYETIRTEGFFTKAGSVIILLAVILEILAIKGVIRADLSNLLSQNELYFSGYNLPLGDIIIIFPALATLISVILAIRTYGSYTRWLALLLFLSSVTLLYMVSKQGFFELLKSQYYYF